MTTMFERFPDILDADTGYIALIVMLLPLSGALLVSQKNPFHALVIRGILGAVASLVYAILGAADVALTEALVGTMLSTTLYAIAVRSSMQPETALSGAGPEGVKPPENPSLQQQQFRPGSTAPEKNSPVENGGTSNT